jgi:hypothetical protein
MWETVKKMKMDGKATIQALLKTLPTVVMKLAS